MVLNGIFFLLGYLFGLLMGYLSGMADIQNKNKK